MIVAFRPLARADLPVLAGWLAMPHVARWWCEDPDLAAVTDRYGPSLDGRDPAELFVIEAGGEAVGFIQRYLTGDDEEWARVVAATGVPGLAASAGIDYLLGDPGLTGRGLGTAAITGFTRLVFARYPAASVVAVAVSQGNPASWRALEKSGYTRAWSGEFDSPDPADQGPQYLYLRHRAATG